MGDNPILDMHRDFLRRRANPSGAAASEAERLRRANEDQARRICAFVSEAEAANARIAELEKALAERDGLVRELEARLEAATAEVSRRRARKAT